MISGFDTTEMDRNGLTEVIGIEIKMRDGTSGRQVELGMWVPPTKLYIPNPRYGFHGLLQFPSTVHTTHGDLNYQVPDVQ